MDGRRITLVVARRESADETATGYFLTGDLVLTVAHVNASPGATFRVRANLGAGTDPWCDAVVEWQGRGDLDAMLLRIVGRRFPWDPVVLERNAEEGPYRCDGYPLSTYDEEADGRNTLPVEGSFGFSEGQLARTLALTTERHVRDGWEAYWKGISGASIFLKSSKRLVGIVVEVDRSSSNALFGLPIDRLLDDRGFRKALDPGFLGRLTDEPFCLVLTAEGGSGDLVTDVADVISGYRGRSDKLKKILEDPLELPVLRALESAEHWATTVRALAGASYLIADVTGFAPGVMLVLGVRAVLRRGVTISVTRGTVPVGGASVERVPNDDGADDASVPPPHDGIAAVPDLPFNVQETRLISYSDVKFTEYLYQAMTEGAAGLQEDPNYLDLPPYHAVRTPKPVPTEENAKSLLVLCPFNKSYTTFFDKLHPILKMNTGDLTPLRLMDLRSPRLVGQALYEQIRWANRCLVDWSGWRSNVFFELGVRLACSDNDPFSVIDGASAVHERSGDHSDPDREQKKLLIGLLRPVEYSRATPRDLRAALKAWRDTPIGNQWRGPDLKLPIPLLAVSETFTVAQESFVWRSDPLLERPHEEQRKMIGRIDGRERERTARREALFAREPSFDAALEQAVRERWIAAWLYLRYLSEDDADSTMQEEFMAFSRSARRALSGSPVERHERIRSEISALLKRAREVHEEKDTT